MERNLNNSDITISDSEIAMLLGKELPKKDEGKDKGKNKESARETFVRKIRVPNEKRKNNKIEGKILTKEEINFLLGNNKNGKDEEMEH